jgi:hypothetical protein
MYAQDTVKLKDAGHKLEEERRSWGQMKRGRNGADHANTDGGAAVHVEYGMTRTVLEFSHR